MNKERMSGKPQRNQGSVESSNSDAATHMVTGNLNVGGGAAHFEKLNIKILAHP